MRVGEDDGRTGIHTSGLTGDGHRARLRFTDLDLNCIGWGRWHGVQGDLGCSRARVACRIGGGEGIGVQTLRQGYGLAEAQIRSWGQGRAIDAEARRLTEFAGERKRRLVGDRPTYRYLQGDLRRDRIDREGDTR